MFAVSVQYPQSQNDRLWNIIKEFRLGKETWKWSFAEGMYKKSDYIDVRDLVTMQTLLIACAHAPGRKPVDREKKNAGHGAVLVLQSVDRAQRVNK